MCKMCQELRRQGCYDSESLLRVLCSGGPVCESQPTMAQEVLQLVMGKHMTARKQKGWKQKVCLPLEGAAKTDPLYKAQKANVAAAAAQKNPNLLICVAKTTMFF